MSWRFSQYSTAVQCLRKYKLIYVDNLTTPQTGDLAFGSALHSAINGVLTGENGEDLFSLYWDSYKDKDVEYGRFKWAELRDLGLNFLSKFTRLHAKKFELEKAEVELRAEYRGVKFQGTPDFLGKYAGRPSLRDFKTSGYNYPAEKRDTALQLNLYAFLAITELKWRPETLGYDVFVKGTGSIQTLTWDFDEKVMYGMLDDLTDYCSSFDQQAVFPKGYPRNPNACLYPTKCPFLSVCYPSGGKNEN